MSNLIPKRVIQSPNVLLQELEGEAVLLNLVNGQYYGLDKNSFHMYKTLVSCSSIDSAYEALLNEYKVDSGQLRIDLDRFINHLLENTLIIDADDES